MTAIGVTSRPCRGYVAHFRGCVAIFRGYIARSARNLLTRMSFSARFRPLPSFYLSSTNSGLWIEPVFEPPPPRLSSKKGSSTICGVMSQNDPLRPMGEPVCYDRSRVGSSHTEATTTRGYTPGQGPLPIRGAEPCGGTAGALSANACSAFFPLMVNFVPLVCRMAYSSECVHQTVW